MMILKGILWMVSALLGIVALCGFHLWLDKKSKVEEYDERQKVEQGRASHISMMTGLIYFLGVMMWMELGELPADPGFLIFAGLLLELMVYHVYCLMTQAALPLSKTAKTTIGGYVTLGVVWFLRAAMYDPARDMTLHGQGIGFWMFAMTSFCCFALAAMHLISHLRNKRE
ncbi:MAG: hypothetical protein IKJ99_09235 [Oscillospiraceae bacterium]|nr:hypothetical protein [Oscillospiraceae bacterium]